MIYYMDRARISAVQNSATGRWWRLSEADIRQYLLTDGARPADYQSWLDTAGPDTLAMAVGIAMYGDGVRATMPEGGK